MGQYTPQLGPSILALGRLEQLVELGPDRLGPLVELELNKLGQLAVLVELGKLAAVVEQLLELDKLLVEQLVVELVAELVAELVLGIAEIVTLIV